MTGTFRPNSLNRSSFVKMPSNDKVGLKAYSPGPYLLADVRSGIRVFSVPATRLAEELGKKMVLNAVMVGFFTAVTKLLEPDAVRKAVGDSVPASFRELNLKAFEKGFAYGLESLADGPHSQVLEDVSISEN